MTIKERCFLYDYKGVPASSSRYSIHAYPAMLHYLLVRDLIARFTNTKSVIYDPFCGSGVTIVESIIQNRQVYGTDINPLALLITDVRSSNYNSYSAEIIKLRDKLVYSFSTLLPDVPKVKNLEFWFGRNTIYDLAKIRAFISNIDNIKIKKFFLCAFSETVRKVSYNRKNEFKRYRMKNVNNFNPNTLQIFIDLLDSYLSIVLNNQIQGVNYRLFLHDVRKKMPFNKEVDFVITSPPYGDSKTTVAYGQFSSFSLDWLRGLNPFGDADINIDKDSLGGRFSNKEIDLPSDALNNVLLKINELNPKRANDVYSFFYDLFLSCQNIVNQLNKNGYICFIVGNRRIANIEIPMDIIVSDFFQYFSLSLQKILVREISNKRMPFKNSPTNIIGKTSNTMKNEFVVIFRK